MTTEWTEQPSLHKRSEWLVSGSFPLPLGMVSELDNGRVFWEVVSAPFLHPVPGNGVQIPCGLVDSLEPAKRIVEFILRETGVLLD